MRFTNERERGEEILCVFFVLVIFMSRQTFYGTSLARICNPCQISQKSTDCKSALAKY